MPRALHILRLGLAPFVGAGLLASMASARVGEDPEAGAIEWNARSAEHLLNRAGFGAGRADIERAVQRGLGATVDELLRGRDEPEPFFLDAPERPGRAEKKGLSDEERRDLRNDIRRADRELLHRFSDWWVEQMLGGPDPLREHMTLFWHGHFTSSYRDVKNGEALVRQNELLRRRALGSFETLLRDVLRDPALLLYLDNDRNTRKNPNENLARELLELFTLGEGHYTERDVKEAARALTGWDVRYPEGAVFLPGRHDQGKKKVLGTSAPLDLDGLVDVILEQEACARWIAGELLAYFEGRDPDEQRLTRYADQLRREEYELEPFLRALFLDPAFYSDEVVGTRISGPIEFLVGAARRLGLEPSGRLVWTAAGQLGQRLFEPPSVKGWGRGRDWITTSTFLQRGNAIGLLLGVVSLDEVLAADEGLPRDGAPGLAKSGLAKSGMAESGMAKNGDGETASGEPSPPDKRALGGELGHMRRLLDDRHYWPRIHLATRCLQAGARADAEIVEFLCDELLAVEVTDPSRAALASFLAAQRAVLGIADGELLGAGPQAEHRTEPEGERVLRKVAHLVLSLPEANLH